MSARNRRNPVHACTPRETNPSRCPVAFQSSEHLRRSEPDSPTELEGRDLAGNAPLVELTAADLEEGGEFGLGEELEFVARRGHGSCSFDYFAIGQGVGDSGSGGVIPERNLSHSILAQPQKPLILAGSVADRERMEV